MRSYPAVFSPLMVNLIRIGESTGHLSEAFSHIHQYLSFEATNIKQIKSAFRYPLFIIGSIILAMVVLNTFVIPSFAKFYVNLSMTLPWETQLLISTSHFFVHYGLYALVAIIIGSFMTLRYIKTAEGRLHWHQFLFKIPILGKLLKRIILIRFCQSLSIMLSSGLPITQALELTRQTISNSVINREMVAMQEDI